MFDNQRYVTKGVIADIPNPLQNMMWYLIESMDIQQDYLQVFELKAIHENGKTMQKIIHRQEQPPYSEEHIFAADETVNAKIFVIDDETHSTMLLSAEY
jgi:hypothetical protein